MEEVVRFAVRRGLKIVPVYSYAKHYFKKHPELKELSQEGF